MSTNIEQLNIEIASTSEGAISKIDKLASSLGKLKGSTSSAASGLKATKDKMEDVASSTQTASSKTSSFSDRLKELASNANSTVSKLSKLGSVAKSASSAFSAFSAVPRYFGGQLVSGITSATSALSGFLGKIKSIILYRAIRSVIKEITSGISDGIKNLYHWSETFNGTFYKSMNQIATEAQYLKNSLGAMFQPLIEYITPFVTYITDKLVSIINLANQFFSALTGKSTYTAAKKVAAVWDSGSSKAAATTKKIKDNTKSTAKNVRDAANEFRRFTLAFDELNILGKNVTSSTGGSGGVNTPSGSAAATTPTTASTGTDYSSMFQTLNISSAIKALADEIKEYIKNSDWQGLGTVIGNKINDLVNSIDYAKYGRKVGEYINGWFSTKYWTLDTINFTNIGSKIATFLNNAISKIDFGIIGRSIVQKLTIGGDLLIGFISGLDTAQAAAAFSACVNGMFEELTKWFNKYNWVDIGTTISGKLFDAITNIDFYGIAKNMFLMWDAALFAAIGVLAGFFDGLAGKIKGYIKWDELSNDVKEQITIIGGIVTLAETAVGAVLAFSGINIPLGIALMASGLATGATITAMNTNLSKLVMTNMGLIKGIVSPALLVVGAILAFSGVNIPLGIGLLAAGAGGMGKTIKENWDAIKDKMEGPLGILTEFLSGLTLVLGFVAVAGGAIPLGIGLIVAGSVGLATALAARWDRIKEKMEGPIGTLTSILSGAMLVLGFVAIAAGRIPLGVGLIVAGSMGLATAIAANWDRMKSYMEGPLGILTNVLSAATLVLGFVAIAAGFIPLGIGLIVAGSAGLTAALPARWNRIQEYIEGPIGIITSVISAATLALGFVAIAAGRIPLGIGLIVAGSAGLAATLPARWNRIQEYMEGPLEVITGVISAQLLVLGMVALVAGHIPLGVGLLVAGATGLATSKGFNFSSLKNYFTGWMGVLTGVVSAASLFIGIIALLGGNIPLGIGLILAGAAGLKETIDANWDNLVQFGKDAKKKVKEGWDSIKLNLLGDLTGTSGAKNWKEAMFGNWLFPGTANDEANYTYQVKIDANPGLNFKKKNKPLELDLPETPKVDVSVGLMKDNWTTVVDWAYKQGNINYDQYVALQKFGWTFIDKWADKFKGSTLFQSISLMKVGWTTISTWVQKSTGSVIKQLIGLAKNGWSTVSGYVNNNKGGTVYQGISLSVNNWNSFLNGISRTLHNWFPSVFAEGGAIDAHGKVSRFAGGGSIVGSKINAYAGGTSSAHGSLFLAGEAGPEIVGHVGGRTEVLNKSQLAATMYAAVNAAMAPAAANFASAAAYMYEGANGYAEDDMEMLLQLVRAGSEATQRQNDLLRQQNEYLRQINAKEFSAEISTADINRAQARSNRRAGTTLVPMTT